MSLKGKIFNGLTFAEAANIDETVAEIAQLERIAAEEVVAQLYVEREALLQVMEEQGDIRKGNKRFFLAHH